MDIKQKLKRLKAAKSVAQKYNLPDSIEEIDKQIEQLNWQKGTEKKRPGRTRKIVSLTNKDKENNE